jgi:S1-C subfamily serine protease
VKAAAILAAALVVSLPLPAAESPRETATVRLIRQLEPGVVAIFSQDGPDSGRSGSGSVIHEDGYILTNDHVVRNSPGQVLLADGTVLPYRTVGRLPEKDLAVILVRPSRPLTAIPLGRSHDLMSGEPVVVGGNPGGRGIVFSSGIVSSPRIMMDMNALTMAHFKSDVRDRFIQFDATSNAGNSGGPLINAEGRQIGVVAAKSFKEDNINYAIPSDRVRQFFAEMLAPEERSSFWLGLTVDTMGERCVVTAVAASSPAERAGLKPGDVLLSANAKSLRHGMDWLLILTGGKVGGTLEVKYERAGKTASARLVAAEYPAPPAISAQGKQPGLRYQLFHTSRLTRLPDFSTLKPAASGVARQLETGSLAKGREDDFALVFEGYMKVPAAGLHRLVLFSDDGSRCFVDGRLAVDNDGTHPPQEMGRWLRLTEGLHRVRVEFFEATGESVLKLILQSEEGATTELATGFFFHD